MEPAAHIYISLSDQSGPDQSSQSEGNQVRKLQERLFFFIGGKTIDSQLREQYKKKWKPPKLLHVGSYPRDDISRRAGL